MPNLFSRFLDANGRELRKLQPLTRFVQFSRDRGREDDASVYETRLAELSAPAPPSSAARIA